MRAFRLQAACIAGNKRGALWPLPCSAVAQQASPVGLPGICHCLAARLLALVVVDGCVLSMRVALWQGQEEESDEEIEALQHGEDDHDDHDDERDGDDGTAADADDDDEEPGEGAGEAGAPREAAPAVVAVAREPERQLSKKELKKKEMEDLEKVLAELGIQAKANGEHSRRSHTGQGRQGGGGRVDWSRGSMWLLLRIAHSPPRACASQWFSRPWPPPAAAVALGCARRAEGWACVRRCCSRVAARGGGQGGRRARGGGGRRGERGGWIAADEKQKEQKEERAERDCGGRG